MQLPLWAGAVGCLAIAGAAAIGDRRHRKRDDLDRVGWIPWPLILILAMIAAAVFMALAIHSD